jgi:large subunit ribosomal protein L21
VHGASVALVVESHELDAKVVVFKKRRRKRYQRTQGHRREVTRVRVRDIICDIAAY